MLMQLFLEKRFLRSLSGECQLNFKRKVLRKLGVRSHRNRGDRHKGDRHSRHSQDSDFFGYYCFEGMFEYWLDRTNNQQTKLKHSSVCPIEVSEKDTFNTDISTNAMPTASRVSDNVTCQTFNPPV